MQVTVTSSIAHGRGEYLTAGDQQPRARRAADLTTVVIGFVFAVWGLYAFKTADPLQESITQFANALPEWAIALFALTYTAGLIFAVVVVIALLYRRRWDGLRDSLLAGLAATVTTLVLVAVFDQLWPQFFIEYSGHDHQLQFPAVRVALVAAVLVAASPYLARPLRRLGWTIVLVISGAAIALAVTVPSGAAAALGVGMICGGAVLLLFGSPIGYPDTAAVTEALREIGLDVSDLKIARDQSWGVRRLVGKTTDNVLVEVKAYGRDATDSQVMAKLWHAARYRVGGGRIAFSRIQSVEHEALVTMLAGRAGINVPEVLAAANANDEVCVLVTTREQGVLLSEVGSDQDLDQDRLVELWRQVGALHAAGLTHGNLSAASIRLAQEYQMCDLSSGSVVFREADAMLDNVRLLFATAVVVGAERAVAAAAEGLSNDQLAGTIGYLQPPVLSQREKRSTKGASKLLKQIREQVIAVTGVEPAEPVKLRRLSAKTIAAAVIIVMFLSALIPIIVGVDYAQLWATLQTGAWWLIILSVLLGQVAFIPQGTALMSAVGRAIPLRPMTILQPAIAFISFAVPGMAGRVTMQSAFLYRYGTSPAASVTKGAVEAVSGFVVQVAVLGLALLTGALALPATTNADRGSHGGNGVPWVIVGVVVALAIITVIVVLRVSKIRNLVVPQIKNAWTALAEVFRSPKLAFGLFGSQIAVQLLWGMSLWVALLSLGVHLSLISCTAVVVATAILQGIIPVPGGIGVSEAVLSALLIPLGVSSDVAMCTAVIWRVATFYLPATEGFFAARYLSKHGYL